MLGRRQEINLQLNQLLDCVLLVLSLWFAYWLRADLAKFFWPTLEKLPPFSRFFWVVAVIAPFTPVILESRGFYQNVLSKKPTASLRQIGSAGVRVLVLLGLCEIFLKWSVESRAVVVIGAVVGTFALLAREAILKRVLRKRLATGHADKERVLLVGQSQDMDVLHSNMTDDQLADVEIVGRHDVTTEPVSRLVDVLHTHSVSRVVFAVNHSHFGRIEEAVQACETEGVEAWLTADFFQTAIARPTFDVMAGKLMLVFHTTPDVSWALWIKDILDRVGAFVIISLTSPIWLAAVIGIKLSSPGPVLFTQDRAGRSGRTFRMFKFRTMCVDAEAKQKELERQNQMSGPVFKVKHDPRIFPLGRWLRRLSIDELPQLLNVLRGEMSLVGPRPLPIYEIARIEKHAQRRRLSVKPGLTCLWQVMGRNKITSFEEWVALDLRYIDNWSLWLDFRILAQTLPAVLKGSGAH
jgi:exopolysaccharide biosynthesis polyprenyl glycosylphosphotransferase